MTTDSPLGTDSHHSQITYTVIQQDGRMTCFPTLDTFSDKEQPSLNDLKKELENPKDSVKIETMKKLLLLMLNGTPLPSLLMHVIRFVMPSRDKTLKKLLMIYWEICQKTNPDGKLKQEMVLVW